MAGLQLLRSNPETAIGSNDYIVNTQGCALESVKVVPRIQEGYQVSIKEYDGGADVTGLEITPKGEDYYFPWVNRGVGFVKVPGNVKDGTVVVTGGMNGCALHVYRNGMELTFYHDADYGNPGYIGQGKLVDPPGDPLLLIAPRQYMLIPYGQTIVDELGPKSGRAFMYQLLCVRSGSKWKVVYSGLIIHLKNNLPVVDRTFTPGVSKFLASFEA